MSYLLDSHIVYWFCIFDKRLPTKIRKLIEDANETVIYSVVTPWELSIKEAKKKIALPKNFFSLLPDIGFDCLPIEESHVDHLRSLPKLHHDPFDRMLVAQAKAEKLTLITADKELAAYPIKTLLVSL